MVIITERKEHIATLNQFLKQNYETLTLSGEDTQKEQELKWNRLESGDYQVLLTTGQYFGEGSDLHNVSRLFLVYPFSFKGKLIQYIGRVQRSEVAPIIYDYHDHKVEYLHRLFLKRNVHYRQLDRQASLFDEPTDQKIIKKDWILDKLINIPIEDLDFQYGLVSFGYTVKELNTKLIFEIENLEIRPEFDVMKSYFAKVLGSQNIKAKVYAEFQDHNLMAQEATSEDLRRIDREIIDSVKFRFVEKTFLKKTAEDVTSSLVDMSKVTELNGLYDSEEDFLHSILENQKAKHTRQLKYLASIHKREFLKLRFVLSPFSFVFLLEGNSAFHLVLETLNTEEATYIWHIEKSIGMLRSKLHKIDKDLEIIRNKGRSFYLEQAPANFSRILHDYTDDRKGFVIWKDLLEERLI